MEPVLHAIGLCSDNHNHIDLLDIFLYGGISSPFIIYIRTSLNKSFKAIYKFFKSNDN